MVYEKQSYVAGSMCDPGLKLSYLSVYEIIEDSVTELLHGFGFDGLTAMSKYGGMWVFTKNSIRFVRRPAWLDKFTVRCYISGHSALRMFVDTELISESGEQLIRSRVEICGLDLETGKIRKPETLGFDAKYEHPEPLDEIGFVRFPKDHLPLSESVKVRSMNIDYCSHTNNVEYVRFILNTYSTAELAERELEGIEMHYDGQSYEGETLDIEKLADPDGDRFFVRCGGTEKTACRIVWKNS